MLAFGSLITIVIVAGIAVLVKWMASSVALRQSAESITPEDLRALEDASAHLVDEIKQTAALAIRDMDDRCEQLRKLILIADQKVLLWSQIASEEQVGLGNKIPETPNTLASAVSGQGCPETMQTTQQAGFGTRVSRNNPTPAERVYELADSGFDPADIAREAGQPIGEVTLLLGLRSASRSSSGA